MFLTFRHLLVTHDAFLTFRHLVTRLICSIPTLTGDTFLTCRHLLVCLLLHLPPSGKTTHITNTIGSRRQHTSRLFIYLYNDRFKILMSEIVSWKKKRMTNDFLVFHWWGLIRLTAHQADVFSIRILWHDKWMKTMLNDITSF